MTSQVQPSGESPGDPFPASWGGSRSPAADPALRPALPSPTGAGKTEASAATAPEPREPAVIPLFIPPRPESPDLRPLRSPGPDRDPLHAYRSTLRVDALVGRSEALGQLFHRMRPAAAFDRLHVLLTGPSGAGKSLVARAIHESSARAARRFVEVNCAAIPRDLFEAEFFGCSRNAYTQATDRPGRFAEAEGGTLLLDEVGEIPLPDQAKLLRVLDRGHYERLGEDRTRRADVRVLAATNRDLEEAVTAGTFRADLYFRLNRYRIHVPSLGERRADIPELAMHLVAEQCRELRLPATRLSAPAIQALQGREWPGNIRELESVIAQALVESHCDGSTEIEPRHCADPGAPGGAAPLDGAGEPGCAGVSYAEATRQFQRRLLAATLDEEDWNITRAAQRLGLARSHIYTLIDHFKIERPAGGTAAVR